MNNLLDFFQELDKNKIEYVVWKNCNLIQNFFEGNENLDIYINQKNKEICKSLLKEKFWIEVKSTTNNHKNINHYIYISNDKIYNIHIYFRLISGNSITKNYDFTNLYSLFENKVFDSQNKLWIMDYNLQLELFKIRLACKHKSLLGSFLIYRDLNNYINEFNLLTKHSNSKVNFTYSEIKINEKKINFYNKNDSNLILNHIKDYKRFNEYISLFLEIKFLFKIFLKKIFRYKKFRFKKDIYIFISGADSSGKSTIIDSLNKLFSKYFKTKKYNIGQPFPKLISHFFIKKKKSKNIKILNKDKKNISIIKILKSINLGLLRYFYSFLIFYFNGKTNLFLLDRYVSEFPCDINGPRLKPDNNQSILIRTIYKIENYFYKLIKTIDTEFRLMTNIDTCLDRNKERFKLGKETDDEIIARHKLFSKSKFKSKRVIELNNDSNKTEPINSIIKVIVKDLNENN